MTHWGQLMFQDAASPNMIQMMTFHDHALVVLTLVLSVTAYSIYTLVENDTTCSNFTDAHILESIWTVLPMSILLFLAMPSLRLLYLTDEINFPSVTIKSIGHQWYWSYEYSDFPNLQFDSYMLPTNELAKGEFRLLEVDNRMVVPMQIEVRMLITAADVIHSWTIPALGIKMDAIPGRLNQLGFVVNRPGVFYGQCSEICGANHSFMPIAMEVIDTKSFLNWATSWK